MELIAKLGLDWKILLAQVVNFGLLLFILHTFVYKPVLKVLDDRRERIKKAMEDAKAIENQKQELVDFRIEQLKKIDAECGVMLQSARQNAEEAKREILHAAQNEASSLILRAKEQIAGEKQQLLSDVQTSVTTLIMQICTRILEREFTPEDQRRLVAQINKEFPKILQ